LSANAPALLASERLDAHRITGADEPFLRAMFDDPRVHATLGGPRDEARVRETVARMTEHWDRTGFGTWVLVERATGELIGWVGLHESDVGGVGGVELLYAVAADHWRRGFAVEAGRAALAVGHDDLGRDEIVAFTLPDNSGSRAVMERLGFTYEDEVDHGGLPHVLYRRKAGASDG